MIVTFVEFAMTCLLVTSAADSKVVRILGHMPTWQVPIQSNSAECIERATEEIERLPESVSSCIAWQRRTDAVVIDEFICNLKVERAKAIERPDVARVIFICMAHKVAACVGRAILLQPDLTSRLVAYALALQGKLDEVRAEARNELTRNYTFSVVAEVPALSEEAAAYKALVIDTFLSGPENARRRAIVCMVFNWDWRVEGKYAHLCLGRKNCPLTCRHRHDSLYRAQHYAVPAILTANVRILNPKNWVGSSVALDQAGLPLCLHGIGRMTVHKVLTKAVTAAAAEAGTTERTGPTTSWERDPKAEAAAHRKTALDFIDRSPDHIAGLMVMRKFTSALAHCHIKYFQLASKQWAIEQWSRVIK